MHVPVFNGRPSVIIDETNPFTTTILSAHNRYFPESLPESLERHHVKGSADCVPTHTRLDPAKIGGFVSAKGWKGRFGDWQVTLVSRPTLQI